MSNRMKQTALAEFGSANEASTHQCQWVGCCRMFDTERAMNIHHFQVHGESIAGVEVDCAWCGGSLRREPAAVEASENHFCDHNCRGKWRSDNFNGEDHPNWSRVEAECDWCGETVLKNRSKAEDRDHLFCDRACFGKWNSENQRGEDNPSWSRETVECEWCGEEISATKSRRENNDVLVCDMECFGEWMSEQKTGEGNPKWGGGEVDVTCDWCGDSTTVGRNPFEQYDHQFCDGDCYGSWFSVNRSGPNSHFWKGGHDVIHVIRRIIGPDTWPKAKSKVRGDDPYRCAMAGCEGEDTQRSSVHHIIPVRAGGTNAEDLLLPICNNCHQTAEAYLYEKISDCLVNIVSEDTLSVGSYHQ